MSDGLMGFDAMTPAEQNAYKQAVGQSIDAREQQAPVQRPDQGVVPIPPNVAGLAKVLVQTGRAPDMPTALRMANSMAMRK